MQNFAIVMVVGLNDIACTECIISGKWRDEARYSSVATDIPMRYTHTHIHTHTHVNTTLTTINTLL